MDQYLRISLIFWLFSALIGCGGGSGGGSSGTANSLNPLHSSSSVSSSVVSANSSSLFNSESSLVGSFSSSGVLASSSLPASSFISSSLVSQSAMHSSVSYVSSPSSQHSSSVVTELIVQAEDYINYQDSTVGNEGGSYRNDSVDIEPVSDVGGGYNVGWATPGEWLEYDVDLLPGVYIFSARVASATSGSYSVSIDGKTIVPSFGVTTSGWHSWATQRPTKLVTTTAGVHRLRIGVESGGVNFNWFKITLDNGSSASRSSIANTTSLAYSKINPYFLLGMESTALWHATNAEVKLSANRSQGENALSFNHFSNTRITSAAINTFKNWGSQIAVDVYLPNQAEGIMELTASIPSKNIRNLHITTINLAEIPKNIFTKITADLPASLTGLTDEYHDLIFEFIISSPATIDSLILDNIMFTTPTAPAADKVEIAVKGNTDILYVIVNDVAREVWRSGKVRGNKPVPVDGKMDISSLFWKGTNAVRVIGINGTNRNPIDVELWINGQSVFQKYCEEYESESQCVPENPEGIRHRYYLTVNTPNLPEAKKLTVNPALDSQWNANLYINDMYVPVSLPAEIYLPEGNYKLGLGKYRDEHLNYQGDFYEQDVDLKHDNASATFSGLQSLGIKNSLKVAILPIKYARYSDTNLTGVLQQSEVAGYLQQLQMTYDIWIKPFSYGLQRWDMSVLPMVENTTLFTNSNQNFSPEAFLAEAGLQQLRSQYQIIIFAFSVYNQNNIRIDGAGGSGAWAGNGFISINNSTRWPNTPNAPHPVFTHEILHVYEQYQRDIYGYYNGVLGLHGAPEQGYLETSPIGELYWLGWYKDFMRNTIGENHTARPRVHPGIIPVEQDLYIGTFETTRYGLGFLH